MFYASYAQICVLFGCKTTSLLQLTNAAAQRVRTNRNDTLDSLDVFLFKASRYMQALTKQVIHFLHTVLHRNATYQNITYLMLQYLLSKGQTINFKRNNFTSHFLQAQLNTSRTHFALPYIQNQYYLSHTTS